MTFPCLIVALALPADVPGANNSDGLSCRVSGSQVHLEWNIAFFREIHGFLLTRDGEMIASLDPAATSYLDTAAPPGAQTYTLFAMSVDGTAGVVGSCQVTVGEGGLRCHVDGRQVRLEWSPLAITVVVHAFQVLRDGVVETSLPPDRFSYETSLTSAGSVLFEVRAVVANDPASPTLPVGACRVEAPCFGMSAEVGQGGGLQVPLEVRLSWQPPLAGVPVGDDIAPYLVLRDGEVLVRTSKTEHTDTVPAPGRYLYEVWFDHPLLEMPTFLVGSCLVDVGDVGVPAPEDLACQVLHVAPGPDAGGINVPPDLAAVLLTWRNPIVYDKVVITRNDMVIATLPGGETRYTDRVAGAGVFDYAVWGVKGNDRSAAARCTVEVGLDEVPPPQQLSCTLAGLNTDENRDAAGNVIDPAVGGIPSTAVVLRWWSPIRYGSVAVFRDGQLLAQLPGDALVYRDVAPPSGQHLYSVVGVLSDGRSSPAAECTVTVGEVVPPVEDLICGVQEKANPDTVDLAWTNGAPYDAVLVFRDGAELARLPGDAAAYRDSGLAPGVYRYDVVGAVGDRRSPRASCQVSIEGPPRLNVLYFQSPDATLNAAGLASASNRLICLLDSVVEVQGWSFGVRSDPRFVVPVSHTLEGTVTAGLRGGQGPAFLSVKLAPEGVTMAVVIDDQAPFEVLPPGRAQVLLGLEYGRGPQATQGELYPVQYSGALGSPPVQVLLVVNGFEVRPATLAGFVTVPGVRYRRADPNGDGLVDISDPMFLLNWLFLGGEVPGCMESADTNGSGEINIADAVYLLSSLYNGGPAPPQPYPECGVARAPLGCEDAGSCQ